MKFLEENKKRPEVKTTAADCSMRLLKKGDGKVSPGPTDKVEVHYHGTLIDGKVLTAQYNAEKPSRFWPESGDPLGGPMDASLR
ncbi:MAG: hypothetical protein R2778_02255 [Saprospiraceae bacterium]